MALGLLFVALAFLAPRPSLPAAPGALHLVDEVAELRERLDVLEEETILDEKELESRRRVLEQLGEQAMGREPARAFETLDFLRRQLEEEGAEAAESALARMEQLAQVHALADALAERAGEVPESLRAEALEELARLTEQLLRDGAATAGETPPLEGIDEAMLQQLASGQADAGALSRLAGTCDAVRQGLGEHLANLGRARLIDPSALRQAEQLARVDSAGLLQFLEENGAEGSMQQRMSAWCEGGGSDWTEGAVAEAGRGSIGKGEGPAPLFFGEPSSGEGAGFSELLLPEAQAGHSERVGLSAAAPEVDPSAAPSASGALQGAEAGRAEAAGQRVLPRHRGAVQRYFERANEGGP